MEEFLHKESQHEIFFISNLTCEVTRTVQHWDVGALKLYTIICVFQFSIYVFLFFLQKKLRDPLQIIELKIYIPKDFLCFSLMMMMIKE